MMVDVIFSILYPLQISEDIKNNNLNDREK